MKKAIIYTRVSTASQAESGTSLQSQEEIARKYAKENDLEVIEVLSDRGLSGRKGNRPGLNRVMDMVNNKEIDAVIVYSMSRFGRSVKDLSANMEILEKKGVQFHSTKEKLDTSTAVGSLIFNVLNSLNQFESDQMGERIRDVKASNKAVKRTYSSPIFGYRNNLLTHQLEPIAEELAVVARIKEWNKEFSFGYIAFALNNEGIKAKNGGKFYRSTVRNIITNPIYA